MTDPAIKVENLSKRYLLGSGVQGSVTESLARGISHGARRMVGKAASTKEKRDELWALRDINFQVERGEALGLIGANGAGKSTLLKLLAQITYPTTGRIELAGRLGSLLEVGTGFHPELTGRENVFLNGAILGMRRTEIMNKYAEIEEFAGIERFMETPVKRYSSGMFVRLAFSVAIHLRPQILLVDEVLAVGDAAFQRKCMDKMKEVTDHGDTTLIFVTHNTAWVRRICDQAIYLEKGRMEMQGPAAKVVDDYLEKVEPIAHGGIALIGPDVRRSGTGEAKLTQAVLSNSQGESVDRVRFREPFRITLTFEVEQPIPDAVIGIMIMTNEGVRLLSNYSTEHERPPLTLEPGTHEVSAELDVTLLPGEFVVGAGVANSRGADIDFVERVLSFTAMNVANGPGGETYPWKEAPAFIRPECEWKVVQRTEAPATLASTRTAAS